MLHVRAFDQLYECAASGHVRNKRTKRLVAVVPPRADDPHKYVRLVLKAKGRQKRVAVRHVIAHCWLPAGEGFKLDGEGWLTTSRRVVYKNGDPLDCSVANLEVVEGQQPAVQQQGWQGQQGRADSRVTVPQRVRQAAGIGSTMSWPSGYDSAGRLLQDSQDA